MEFTNSRELKTVMEFDRRETGESLPETREIMSKNDFAQVKRYIITTTMKRDLPDADLEQRNYMRELQPIDQVEKWRNDYHYFDVVVTIQEDDKPPVEVHRKSGNHDIERFYNLHHEWVKKTFDGVML